MHAIERKIDREMRSGVYTLLILKAISELGESYGYEIEKYIYEKSGGQIMIKDATVYPILRYLTKNKVLKSYWTEPGKGVPRKYYQLTDEGKEVFKNLLKRYRELEARVNKVLEGDE